MGLAIDQLCEIVAACISDLDASAYEQAGYSSTWTETGVPTSAIGGANPVGHLQFCVLTTGSPNTELEDDHAAGEAYIRTGLRVMFGYHIRTGADSQIPDERQSMRAAHDLVSTLMADRLMDGVVHLVDPYAAPMITADGEWLLCTVVLSVLHDYPL